VQLKILTHALTPLKQVAMLLQRDCTARWVSYGQKWKTVSGRQYFMNIIGLFATIVM